MALQQGVSNRRSRYILFGDKTYERESERLN
jgi:hypothetical protein